MADLKAKLRYLRKSPRKVRLLANLIRGKSVKQANQELKFASKDAAAPLMKILKSAEANAKHNFGVNSENLIISEIKVDEGPTFKRFMPRAFGRAAPIRKRTSHITLSLSELADKTTKKDNEDKKDNKQKTS